ncbi:hypothetical protein KEJ18_06985 [Candidatus Bathyarchaeota archaeon]|nr:hypothetical protein [Candidatus Bathyarchaeota archaeon]
MTMRNPLKDLKALSQTVTTMILLVIPVMLSGGVAMYAYQLISSEIQIEVVTISKQYIWIFEDGSSYAALEIDNIGGRDALIDKIEVRGVEVLWSTVYYYKTTLIITDSLNCPENGNHSWINFEYTPSKVANFTQASGDIPVPSGYTIAIYIKNPDNLTVNDVGRAVSITIYTGNAQYQVFCYAQSNELDN